MKNYLLVYKLFEFAFESISAIRNNDADTSLAQNTTHITAVSEK